MRTAVCECSGCGLKFSGVASFDRHRVGRYEKKQRRCLAEREMITQDFIQLKGQWKKQVEVPVLV